MQRVLLFGSGLLAGVVVASLSGVSGGVARGAGAVRKVINMPQRQVAAPFSDSVLAGETLYIAGKLGIDPKTGKPPDDPSEEARLMLDRLKANLAVAGMTMDDLVKVEVHCSDISLFEKFNAVYTTYFTTTEYPARAFLGSGPLLRGARFEITGIAMKR